MNEEKVEKLAYLVKNIERISNRNSTIIWVTVGVVAGVVLVLLGHQLYITQQKLKETVYAFDLYRSECTVNESDLLESVISKGKSETSRLKNSLDMRPV